MLSVEGIAASLNARARLAEGEEMPNKPSKFRLPEKASESAKNPLEITSRFKNIRSFLKGYLKRIRRLTGCDACGIRIRSQKDGAPCHAWDEPSHSQTPRDECLQPDPECLCSKLIRMKSQSLPEKPELHPLLVQHASQLRGRRLQKEILQNPILKRQGSESIAILPIQSNGRILGFLYAGWKEPGKISAQITRWLDTAAHQLVPLAARIGHEESIRRDMDKLRDRIRQRQAGIGRTHLSLMIERSNLRAMFDAMADGVYIVSADGNLEYMNPAMMKVFGDPGTKKCWEFFQDLSSPCGWCRNKEIFAGNSVRWKWKFPKTGRTYELFDTPIRSEAWHSIQTRNPA